MVERELPDKRAVRRSFERAAATYDRHSVLQTEIGGRLLAHLEPMRLEPRRLIDLGCGTGAWLAPLEARFPKCDVIGIDVAPGMLARAAARTPAWKRVLPVRRPRLACADAERLPLAAGAVQLVFSNLALQWCDPAKVFAEAARVLPAGGLFLFSTFGPDTLKELRAAFAEVDGYSHVNRFVDMHDLGDALVHASFADPVMEMEVITLEYPTVDAIARDLKAIGAHNSLPSRPRGLAARSRWDAVVASYEKWRRGAVLPASYEVIYGHAWKVAPRKTADGRQVIDFQRGAI
ncbi:MAG: malonyl-ACP O-methyltransferase BioC [Usitatibacter sp.]